MSKAYKEKELFDKVRRLPTEVDLDQIDQIIQDIDSGKITLSKNGSLNNYFTFKTIIMTSIGIILSSIFIFFMYPANTEELANFDQVEIESMIQFEQIVFLDDIKDLENTADDTKHHVNPAVSFSTLEPMDLQLLPTAISKQLTLNFSDFTIITEASENVDQETLEVPETTDYHSEPIYRNANLSNKYPATVPELSNWAMKKYKRTLLKSLLKDGLIISKESLVEMKLHENEIILNDKKLNDNYFLKYRNLLSKIGYGPERKILVNSDFILIGDFTKKGFVGTGRGKFTGDIMAAEAILDSDPIVKAKEHLDLFLSSERQKQLEEWKKNIEEDEMALDKFASEISAVYTPSKTMYLRSSINLRRDEPKQLHNELYSLLIEHNLIVNRSSLVVIELSDKKTRINGEEINEEVADIFSKILKKYRISARKNRQIRMSEFMLKAGDLEPGKFKGTITYFHK